MDYWLNRLDALPPAPELPLEKSPCTVTRPRFVRRIKPRRRDLVRLKAAGAAALRLRECFWRPSRSWFPWDQTSDLRSPDFFTAPRTRCQQYCSRFTSLRC